MHQSAVLPKASGCAHSIPTTKQAFTNRQQKTQPAHQSAVLLKASGCASARNASRVQAPGPASASALSPALAQGRGMVV